MEALTKYSFRTHVRDVTDLKVKVGSSANPGRVFDLFINRDNLAERKFVQVGEALFSTAIE